MNPEQTNLLEFIHQQILMTAQNPEHDTITPTSTFTNLQPDPGVTLLILTGIAIRQYANLITKTLGRDEAINLSLDQLMELLAIRREQ